MQATARRAGARRRSRILFRATLLVIAVLLAFWLTARLAPAPPLSERIALSRAVLSADGRLLRISVAADQQIRLWTPLEQMPPTLIEAVKRYEDRLFDHHPGVDPLALARSVWATLIDGNRQGGSTLTMQLARRLDRLDTKSVGGKLRQIGAALWLEARYPKRAILEAYLNVAPYGGNLEGVGAASVVYFGKSVRELTLAEALTLAVIPQNPNARRAGAAGRHDDAPDTPATDRTATAEQSARALTVGVPTLPTDPSAYAAAPDPQASVSSARLPPALAAARARLWAAWLERHPQDKARAFDVLHGAAPRARPLPLIAPHLADAVLAQAAREATPAGPITSSVDRRAQAAIERVVANYLATARGNGIRNAVVLLADARAANARLPVRALVGSADYFDATIDGQVNGAAARRSPGSTIKPFVYALALDQGVLHPLTVLRDTPTAFGAFSPENFDGRFVGPIAAQDALIRSRNIPAVAVAAQLNRPSLYDFLREAGVERLAPERHYGLALALGGGEMTMEELVRLYGMLANGGTLRPLTYRTDQRTDPRADRPAAGVAAQATTATATLTGAAQTPVTDRAATPLLSPAAAYVTLQMLARNPRPDTGEPARPAVAWKTGTSWGFRDAWSIGVFDGVVLAVWIGNFDGSANPAFVGAQAAAPLFFRIVDALRAQRLLPPAAEFGVHAAVPSNLARVEVCAASGDLPNALCPQHAPTWFIPGVSPIKVSSLHRAVWVETATGRARCGPAPGVAQQVFEFWSADMLRQFREAGMPRRAPPVLPDCGHENVRDGTFVARGDDAEQLSTIAPADAGAPRIASPHRATAYLLRAGHAPPEISLRADASVSVQRLHWFVDRAYLGSAAPGEPLIWHPSRAGRFTLRVVDDSGAADVREVGIEAAP